MNSLLAFVFGFMLCRLLHSLYMMGRITLFMHKSAEDALKLLGNAAEDMAYMRQLKYQTVEKYGDKEQLKVIKNIDDYVFNAWKRKAIGNYKHHFPAPYNKSIPFSTWEEAMQVLNEIYKHELSNTNAKK